MSKKNYVVDSKVVAKVAKDAEKVKKIHEQIKKLQRQLADIKEDNNWLSYLGEGSTDSLTEEEIAIVFPAHEVIKYGERW